MSLLYGESHRKLQREFDTERLADRIEQRLFHEHVTPDDKAFIERLDMFFLATRGRREGKPNCSYKGGDPGFVRVLDPKTLAFPNYDGNGMYLSMGNTLANPEVGMLFIDFERGSACGSTEPRASSPAGSVGPAYLEAQFVVKVHVSPGLPQLPALHSQDQLVER